MLQARSLGERTGALSFWHTNSDACENRSRGKRFLDEVNMAASDAEAVRVLLNGTGLESKAGALKQHLYRRRKHRA